MILVQRYSNFINVFLILKRAPPRRRGPPSPWRHLPQPEPPSVSLKFITACTLVF